MSEQTKGEGEFGVKLNEPTTGEIVRELRLKTKYGMELMKGHFSEKDFVTTIAADRLEQLERDLETFKTFHERYAEQTSKKYVEDVCALTARAEQAEKERNLAVEILTDYEDALFDECDKSYQNGYMDGYTQRGEQDDED